MNTQSAESQLRTDIPIVCVGGSAGGLEAYTRLLSNLPSDTTAAVVVVNHMRHVATSLHEILQRYTTMPVKLIAEGMRVQPNHVYVIPSGRDLFICDRAFRLKPLSKTNGWPDVITLFMRSLSENWKGKLFAVIVSGLDADGAEALFQIKRAGGTTIAQKPSTASQPDMPENAINTGCVDLILAPEEIAVAIKRLIEAENSPSTLRSTGTTTTVVEYE